MLHFEATSNGNIHRTNLNSKLKEYHSALEIRIDKNLTRINVNSENSLTAKLLCCGGNEKRQHLGQHDPNFIFR